MLSSRAVDVSNCAKLNQTCKEKTHGIIFGFKTDSNTAASIKLHLEIVTQRALDDRVFKCCLFAVLFFKNTISKREVPDKNAFKEL